MKTFTIKPYDVYDISFFLNVCGARKEMLRRIQAHFLKRGGVGREAGPGTMGMFCPAYQKIDHDTPGVFSNNVFGTMFLNLADLTMEIIIHETAHAAFAWEHCIRRYTGNFDLDCENEQEEYCYFIGRTAVLARDVIKKNYPQVRI